MESQPQNPQFRNDPENFHPCIQHFRTRMTRDQARRRLGRNSHHRVRNFALNGTQGEVGVSLKKYIFFLRRLIFILSHHKCMLW